MLTATASQRVCGTRVDAVSYQDVIAQVTAWAQRSESRSVCCANVHMVMEAFDSPAYRAILDRADLVTPDGMPLVWALRLLGLKGAQRTYGPDLTTLLLAEAERQGIPVGFHGASRGVLGQLILNVRRRYPALRIVYHYSPPFRKLNKLERELQIAVIHDSGARLLFVGLGCPKQERWVIDHRDRIPAVMLAVGAAFDFLAGATPQAPRWMMAAGLEWLFRLATEPGRLWLRYFRHNPRFIGHFLMQLLDYRSGLSERHDGADRTVS